MLSSPTESKKCYFLTNRHITSNLPFRYLDVPPLGMVNVEGSEFQIGKHWWWGEFTFYKVQSPRPPCVNQRECNIFQKAEEVDLYLTTTNGHPQHFTFYKGGECCKIPPDVLVSIKKNVILSREGRRRRLIFDRYQRTLGGF